MSRARRRFRRSTAGRGAPRRISCSAVAIAALGVMITAGPPTLAAADTIYLRNGRTIHTASARVEGDRVVFSQFGGRVSIPLDQVARIVDDEEVEARAATSEPSARAAPPAAAAAPSSATVVTVTADAPASSKATYWLEQIDRVDRNIDRIQAELDRLPEYSEADQRLFRFSGQIRYFVDQRAKWERLMAIFQRQRRMLLEGARKAGIAPGALRDVRSSR